ncbi:MAG: histidine phosphatase family protein [Beijerinckiaceae bacterium]|jgi:probable phosphoglycerate mutase|nr:histidine phosphatase family protein [Beijerinckiaceae bacterium]
MPILYFFRHGETDWNAEGRLQGQTDIPLNSKGRQQASAIGRNIGAGKLDGVDARYLASLPFIASPLLRTRETMALLRAGLGLPPEAYAVDDRLKEICFGRWEGSTWRDIVERDGGGAQARDRDKWNFVPPGGESYEMVRERVAGWLDGLTGDACVVAHGGVARVLLVLMAEVSRRNAVGADIWQGKLLRIENGRHDWLPGPGHWEP